MTIRIMLVDDQEMVRRGFAMVLGAEPDLNVVAEAEDGQAALDLLAAHEVDVIVMDVRMPRMNGVEATRQICAGEHPPRVLILTTFDLDEYVYEALGAGASGFLLKDAGTAELTSAIRHISAGDAVVAPSATRRLIARFAAQEAPTPTDGSPPADLDPADSEPASSSIISALTPREIEVVRHVAQGLSNLEIAEALVLTEGTVKTHVSSVLTKLDLRDRVQIVVMAFTTGLVTA